MPKYIDADALSAKMKEFFGTQNGEMPSAAEIAILSAIEEAPSVERCGKWTSVAEALPQRLQSGHTFVVLTRDNDVVCFDTDEYYDGFGFYGWDDKVTHWMPLPELPRKDGE